jgi:hypothetical protein
MQLLISTGTTAGTQPIYLPYDKAPVPFGDPLACSLTAATPTVVTVPGYVPTNRDAVSLSVSATTGFLSSLAGLTTISLQLNTTYYVCSVSGDTFSLTTNKASGSDFPLASITTLGQFGGQPWVHLLSNQVDGTTIPFKPGNTCLAMVESNQLMGTNTVANLTILGAPDLNTVLATGTYGAPLGPNALGTTGWNVIATVNPAAPKLIQLNYDWIVASGSTATLVLIQN